MRTAFYILVLTAAAAACGRATEPVDPPVTAEAGDTITLRYGQMAVVGGGVRLSFRAVEADSRCPINVVCVWAGDAAIRIDGMTPGEPWRAVVLHTTEQPRSAEVGGYTIELVEVAPARVEPDSPRPSHYSVRLAISRG